MAKRKTARQRPDVARLIAGLFDASDGTGNLSIGADMLEPSSVQESSAEEELEIFVENINSILDMIPRPIATKAKLSAPHQITFECIDSDYRMAGTYVDRSSKTYQVFVSGQFDQEPAGCSCDISQLQFPCTHVVHFITQAVKQIKDRDKNRSSKVDTESASEIVRRILGRDFHSIDHVDRFLLPDQTDYWLEGMSRNWKLQQMEVPGCDTLPPNNSKDAIKGRIVWNLTLEKDSYDEGEILEIEALLQTPKRRGEGYTKGKRVSSQRLRLGKDLPLDETDRKVISEFEYDDTPMYFEYGRSRRDFVLPPTNALKHLIGSDRVALDGQSVRVTPKGMMFGLVKTEDSLHLRFVRENGKADKSHIFSGNDVLVHVDAKDLHIGVAKMSPEAVALHCELSAAPKFATSKIAEVAKTLRPFQKVVSLLLPKSTDGASRPFASPLVVILRSRGDGSLDYGIRFRDAAGQLHLPAAGPCVHSIVDGKQKYQAIRGHDNELRRAAELVEQLGLHADAFGGWFDSVNNLGESLKLISSLQSLASEKSSDDAKIEFMWDRTGEAPIRFAGNISRGNVKVDITKKRNWFRVGGTVEVGGESIALPDVLANLTLSGDDAMSGDFVKLAGGQWARIEDKLRDRLVAFRTATHDHRGELCIDATAAGEMQQLADDEIEIRASDAWQKCVDRLLTSRDFHPTIPENLDANLRDYQVEGYRWMSRLARWGVGGVLADDMGLGKTLQALAVLLDRADDGPTLVIAPTSVGFNWAREANRFAPDLIVHLYRETDRGTFLQTLQPGDVVICSYGLAMRDADALAAVQWHTLVLDEAQAIKNSRSKTSIAIANLTADWTIALTGTPVENHLGELWSLFHVVSPGVFGGWGSFRDRFASPIEKDNDLDTRRTLANRLKPFVLRRTKAQVLTELPARTEMNLYVDLSKAERQCYEAVRRDAISDIKKIAKDGEIKDARFQILAAMTRLRQLACHPAMVDENYRGDSAKLDCLIATMRNLQTEGHRVLIFSQFVKHLTLIRSALEENGITYEYLDGGTPAAKRQDAVDRFQSGNADAFLISLKAGGTGLNLTAADYVIHMDPWWNPAVEDQATDRAHRMGQTKPVMVYRIVARGTIEQEILKMHEDKRDLAAGVIDGTAVAAKLSNEDLIQMLTQHEV